MYDVALAIGDSHTEMGLNPDTSGWLAHLARFYDRRMDVLNRGIADLNTNTALDMVASILLRTATPRTKYHASWAHNLWNKWHRGSLTAKVKEEPLKKSWPSRESTLPSFHAQPRLLIIFLGTSDAHVESSSLHVPLPLFASNLHNLVNLIRDPESEYYSPNTQILFITPPPVSDIMHRDDMLRHGQSPQIRNADVKMYAEAVKSTAQEFSIPCVDLWSALEVMSGRPRRSSPVAALAQKASNEKGRLEHIFDNTVSSFSKYTGYESFLADGVHLNANGNKLLFKLIVTKILTTWPDLKPA